MYQVLTDQDVEKLVSMKLMVSAIERAFEEKAGGTLISPPRFRVETKQGSLVFTAGAATAIEKVIGFRVYDTLANTNSGTPVFEAGIHFNYLADVSRVLQASSRLIREERGLCMSTSAWPQDFPVAQVRIARPTDKLNEVVRFYTDGIGLERIGGFKGHQGYDGEILGLPGVSYHLEFTQHVDGSPCLAPTRDNLLVFYIPNLSAVNQIVERLRTMGYPSVPPENPYWEKDGVTIEDPDGWRVVLMRRSYTAINNGHHE